MAVKRPLQTCSAKKVFTFCQREMKGKTTLYRALPTERVMAVLKPFSDAAGHRDPSLFKPSPDKRAFGGRVIFPCISLFADESIQCLIQAAECLRDRQQFLSIVFIFHADRIGLSFQIFSISSHRSFPHFTSYTVSL